MALSDEAFLGALARDSVVQGALSKETRRIRRKAETLFAAHDRPGGHQIVSGKTNPVDHYVGLTGPAPRAVEFGHFTPSGDKFVDGLHVIGKAAR